MRTLIALSAMLTLAACGGPPPADGESPGVTPGPGATTAAGPAGSSAPVEGTTPTGPQAAGEGAPADRTGELVNPDDAAVVFLYHDLTGITPPIDRWVEDDNRVKFARPVDKAAEREAVRAELAAAPAVVHNVGTLRLTMNANLSDYDPGYGEFTVQALSPSSIIDYTAFGQKVTVGFINGATAQLWKVDPAQAQAVRDQIGYPSRVSVDVVLRITGVQPTTGGGRIMTRVVEYELRNEQSGTRLAHVTVAP